MNKTFPALLLCAVSVILLSCNKEKDIAVTSVSLSQPTAEMIIGETVQLIATVLPSDATDKSVTWASSKQSVATVSGSGKVTAVAEGVSTITASSGGKSATCMVTVSKNYVAVTSVTLNKSELVLEKGKTESLTATINPSDATDQTVTWSSSESTVASVDNSGKVTAVVGGSAVITAKAGEKQATCTVTVTVQVESITLDKESITLEEESSITLVATVKPDDTTDKSVAWSSSNNEVANVDDKGKVTAIKEGEATITAKAGEKEASCKVIVSQKVIPVESIELDKTEISLVEGEEETITATVKPDNATEKTITWTTSSSDIAKVDNGKVTAITPGEAIITAHSGEHTANCKVEVTIHPSKLSIVFKDENLKSVLVGAYDSNGDGELSYAEAEAVEDESSFKELFGNAVQTFTSFEEFQFFTGIKTIPSQMFRNWISMTAIVLPNSITSIMSLAFEGCEKLESIIIPQNVERIGEYAFRTCKNLQAVSLPNSLSYIGTESFRGCSSIVSISLPESVKEIGGSVFYGCSNLETIQMPSSINRMGQGVFEQCRSLKNVNLPSNITIVERYTFSDCESLSTILIPSSVEWIQDWAFNGCLKLASITFSDNITFIGSRAFNNCKSLSSIKIPRNVTYINAGVFAGCTNLWKVEMSPYINSIGMYAFQNCSSLQEVELPEQVATIGEYAFEGCNSLVSCSFSSVLTTIGKNAFSGCTHLGEIDLPESVTSIGDYAFLSCPGLQSISIRSTDVPQGGKGMFSGSFCPIYVPSTSLSKYKSAVYWYEYAERIAAIINAVDLGLSVRWSTCNLGASSPEEYGDYYAWGEIEKKNYYDGSSYKWFNDGKESSIIKYNTSMYHGTVDNRTVLEAEDDVAHAKLGGKWRMPTDSEWSELINQCTWTWTMQNGVNGELITAPNGNSIFLPAAGCYNPELVNSETSGSYWSSSLRTDVPYQAFSVAFSSDSKMIARSLRICGRSIRPVTD